MQYVDYNGRYKFSDSDFFRNAVVTNFRRPGQRTLNQGHYPHKNDSSPDLSCRVVSCRLKLSRVETSVFVPANHNRSVRLLMGYSMAAMDFMCLTDWPVRDRANVLHKKKAGFEPGISMSEIVYRVAQKSL